ncbi:MAG TPA: hypothetical protein VEH76_08270 [Methylocystis sp.]|nr:hypothetical protein [Methylocystis sp.]
MAKQAGARGQSKKGGRKSKAAGILERAPAQGWAITDQDEIDRRRWRGHAEISEVAPLLSAMTRILGAVGRNEPSLAVL